MTKDEVLGLLKTYGEQQVELKNVVNQLVEKSKEPASKAGTKPEELLAAQVQKHGVVTLGPGGLVAMPRGNYRKKSRLNPVENAEVGNGSFGGFLNALRTAADMQASMDDRAKAMHVCKSYGAMQYKKPLDAQTYGPDEYIAKTALAESSAVSGGYTVLPTDFSNQLFEIAIEDNIVDKKAYHQPLTTRQCTIPALDQVNETFTAVAGQSNLLAGMNLSWVAEAATRKETEPLFRNVVGTAWEGSFYSLVSNNLLADNAVGLESYLTELFGRVVGWGLDYAYLQGNGVGQPLGVQNCKAVIKVTRAGGANTSTLAYADICKMEEKLYTIRRKQPGICWIVHPTTKSKITQLNDNSGSTAGTGRVLFQPYNQGAQEAIDAPEGAQTYGYLLGYPVYVSEKVPALGSDGDVGLYDFGCYAVFKRQEIEIAVSTQVSFLQNSTAYRIVVRGDGQPMLGNYITYADAGANSTASPFILLH